MADPSRGRGRGLALLEALKKSQMQERATPKEESPEPSPGPSAAPSVVSAATATTLSIGGRGRIAAKLLSKPGPVFTPASDVSPSVPPGVSKGAGRGIMKLLQAKSRQMSTVAGSDAGVSEVTQKLAETSISGVTQTTSKSKYFREVKDTPPVVKKGTTGTPCNLTANYIYLKFEENNVYEYEVKYEPDQDYKNLRFKLLNEHSQYFKVKSFDGHTLYVPHQLPDEALNLVSTNPFDNSKVKIYIIFRRTRLLSEMIHIYNVLFKQIMKDLELVRFGRQHFSQEAAIQIPQHKLEVWPGYAMTVDEYEGGLMLTLDSTHRVLRTETVLSFIKDIARKDSANWMRVVSERLVGCSVMTTYNNKLFRVDDIKQSITPKSTFEKNEGGQVINITYIEYYKKNYGIDIMDWDQPMLISKDAKRLPGSKTPTDFVICLVPELCQLTGLTDVERSNFLLMKDVATYTRITPNQRHAAFKKYIRNVLENENARNRLKGWGLSLAPETINITGRTLAPEKLHFGNNIIVPGRPDANWNRAVISNPVMQAVDILRWIVMCVEKDKQVTKNFVETLKRCSGPMGINVATPQTVFLKNDRPDSYVTALKQSITKQLQLVVLICPNARDDRYAAIKRICCFDKPMPSQVINARTIMNQDKLRAVTQKILLQINCKLGGTLWNIGIPYKTAMVVGIDSYHDAGRKNKSVFTFVASYNQTMTHWYSRAVFQQVGQEIGDCIKSCLLDSLRHYLRINGKFPERIIIYRDGVGDGQFKLLQDYEIPQIKLHFKVLDADYSPVLTYIVVQKRINTRVFLRNGNGLENPAPGTVVDHAIMRRDWYDFLIVSQKVTQGTVTPTHYVVIYDGSDMTPDQCQRMTYKMCHLYYNWPGTVRVPAPCQYAHKLAYLVGQNIRVEPSEELTDRLFFL